MILKFEILTHYANPEISKQIISQNEIVRKLEQTVINKFEQFPNRIDIIPKSQK